MDSLFSSGNLRKCHSETSKLAHMELKSNDPIDVYREWQNEAKKFSKDFTDIICLSTVQETSSRECIPRGRHVLLRKYDSNGFRFFTDSRGRKSQELSQNNHAAMSIYWIYQNYYNERIYKQVRIEGKVDVLPRNETEDEYNKESFNSKIRSHLCHQDSAVNWDEMKKQHNELLLQAETDENLLTMPDHYIGYKLVPTWMEFYFSKDNFIADRIEFNKDIEKNIWTNKRIAA